MEEIPVEDKLQHQLQEPNASSIEGVNKIAEAAPEPYVTNDGNDKAGDGCANDCTFDPYNGAVDADDGTYPLVFNALRLAQEHSPRKGLSYPS